MKRLRPLVLGADPALAVCLRQANAVDRRGQDVRVHQEVRDDLMTLCESSGSGRRW